MLKVIAKETKAYTPEDCNRITEYFKEKGLWECYLIHIMGCKAGIPFRAMKNMKFEDLFDYSGSDINVLLENDLLKEIITVEDNKYSKPITVWLDDECKEAINLWLHNDTNVSTSIHGGFVIHMMNKIYSMQLQRAAEALSIDYYINVTSDSKYYNKYERTLPNGKGKVREIKAKMKQMGFTHYIYGGLFLTVDGMRKDIFDCGICCTSEENFNKEKDRLTKRGYELLYVLYVNEDK